MRPLLTLLLAALLLVAAAAQRPPEYDESYSLFLTAGDPRPPWPQTIFTPAQIRHFYTGHPSLQKIATDLKTTDVHPPTYFWALSLWRRLFGPAWLTARLLSVLFTLAALATLAWIAALTGIPPATTILLTILTYGFAYTGIVARGFALAQLFNLLATAFMLSATRASRTHSRRLALASGLTYGLAAFTNYLAIFTGLAALFWLCLHPRRQKLFLPAAGGIVLFFPALLYFFRAQHNSRIGQFVPFSPLHSLALMAKDYGAAFFGGLPVYAGAYATPITAALALIALITISLALRSWRPGLILFALAFCATPVGLFALGIIFNNTPIEIRYLAFSLPFAALILASTLPRPWLTLLLAIEACGIAGLILAPATMQPQALAARQIARLNQPTALILLPFGNDGVGIPGPFLTVAPANARILLIKPGALPNLTAEQSLILPMLHGDSASTAALTEMSSNLNANPCWRHQTPTPLLTLYFRTCKAN